MSAQVIDIDVEHIQQADAYLLNGTSPAGRAWIALNISAKTPRHLGKVICEPHEFPFLYEEATADGLLVC